MGTKKKGSSRITLVGCATLIGAVASFIAIFTSSDRIMELLIPSTPPPTAVIATSTDDEPPPQESAPEWTDLGGTWNFSDDSIYATGRIGFNKAYLADQGHDDLTYEVTFRKTSDNDGPLGLLIRYDEADDAGYLLLIWPHGGYQFSALGGADRRMLASEDPSSAVNPGTEWNTAVITAVGPQITVTLNGTEVASFTDRTFQSGMVGLVIHGDSDQFAEFKSPSLIDR